MPPVHLLFSTYPGRGRALFTALGLLMATSLGMKSHAQEKAVDWPQKGRVVRLVVPFQAGNDGVLRLIALRLGEMTGGTFVVENKPGAGSIIGALEVAKAPADGHTLLYTVVVTHTQNPHLYKKLPYDPFRDFTPLVQTIHSGTVLVTSPKSPFNNVKELIAYAKSNPGKLNYASYSLGSTSHLNGEILTHNTGTNMVHVPYKGLGDATHAVMSGDVQLYFDGTSSAVESTKAGKLKMLGVASEARLPAVPDVPTISEQGVAGIDIMGWQGIFAPGGMPAPLAERIASAVQKVLALPEVADSVRAQGNAISGAGPEEFKKIIRKDYDRWGVVIRRTGIQLD